MFENLEYDFFNSWNEKTIKKYLSHGKTIRLIWKDKNEKNNVKYLASKHS